LKFSTLKLPHFVFRMKH